MARLFDDGATQYLKINSAVVTVPPFTMACWFRSDDTTVNQIAMSIADKDATAHHSLYAGGGEVGDPAMAYTWSGVAGGTAVTTTAYTANTWYHACGVWAATNDRRVFIDGGSKGTDNTNLVVANVDCASIGLSADSTPIRPFSGRIAEAAIWNVALTDEEVAVLACGYAPTLVRPQSLIAYWPLIRDTDDDIIGGYSMTAFNGPTIAPHAPVFYQTPPLMLAGLPAAPPPPGPPPAWTGGPTTPSLHETLGLSIAYADPLVKSPRAAYIGELRREVTAYEHETAAIGGYLTARFDLSGDMVDVNDWFERGIGRHIEVAGPDLTVLWEGFVNSVAVSAGQYAATRGPLVEIANRVYAVYSERDTSVDPPTVIPGQVTTIAQDTVSQGKYGIWEKRVSAGEDTALGAQRQRDSFLRENKEPTTDDPRIVLEAGGQVSVAVECMGYWAWMLAYPYLDTAGSGTVTAQTKVQYVLAADANGIFNVSYSHVGYNPDLAPRYENSGTPAWEVVKALTARGDANDNRWLFGVYAGREAYYRQAPTVEKYQHRLADPAQRIETIIGDEVDPWDVQPGEWVYLPDFLTGRGQPIVAADKRDDPRFLFVEAVRYRAPYSAEITGTRVGRLAQILAKKGVGGGGG